MGLKFIKSKLVELQDKKMTVQLESIRSVQSVCPVGPVCPVGQCVLYNRGGASEASVATLTGDVDGSSRYIIRASSPWANCSTRMRKWC